MRRAAIVATMLLGCGRIGFDEQSSITGDAGGDAGVAGFSKLVAYADQTCAVFGDHAYCWGANDLGQLGDGTIVDRELPTEVKLQAGRVAVLDLGETHGCAIVETTMYCWGEGFPSVAGSVASTVALPAPAIDLALGRGFTCALTDANKALCFGGNTTGQLGDGSFMAHATPMVISGPSLFVELDGGDDHVCGVTATGTAMCWGHNDDGTLGTGSMNPPASNVPVPVMAVVTHLPHIAGWHACSLEADKVKCWGRNTEGELGDSSNVSTAAPKLVPGLAGITAIEVGGGPTDHDASCAIDGTGAVQCWGAGLNGRLGNGATSDSKIPVAVQGLPGPATAVAIGYDHACALLADGDVWCWGRGDRGQLGNGGKTSSLVPVRVVLPR